MDKIIKFMHPYLIFTALLFSSHSIYSQSKKLPPINDISFVLDSDIYASIPDLNGKKVSNPLYYFNNIPKSKLSQYIDKVINSGFTKLYGYKWNYRYGFQYGFVKDNMQLKISGYYKDKKLYGMEVRVTRYKSDSFLEEGELNSDQLINLINKKYQRNYNKEKYIVKHIYMNDLWDKVKAQVVVLIENKDKDPFNYFYAHGNIYLIQNNHVCELGDFSPFDRSLIYNLIDFDEDGYYELEQNRYIGSGIIHCEKTIIKNGEIIYNKTE
jgi:hypothetical protein